MKWRVQGADRTTGRNVGVIVDAMNQEEAAQTANAKGVLVASVEPAISDIPLAPAAEPEFEAVGAVATATGLATAPPAVVAAAPAASRPPALTPFGSDSPPPPPTRKVTIPNYDDIISSAGWLNGVASCIGAVGWVVLMGFVLLIIKTLYDRASGGMPNDEQVQRSLWWIAMFLACGLVFLGLACIMRLLAAAGMAVRDLCRNSFRRDQQP